MGTPDYARYPGISETGVVGARDQETGEGGGGGDRLTILALCCLPSSSRKNR